MRRCSMKCEDLISSCWQSSLFSFGFWFKIRSSRSDMWILKWLPTFCPMVQVRIFHKIKRNHSFTNLSSFILAARPISNFLICCWQRSRWRPWSRRWAFVCVCLSLLSRAATCALFDEHYISLQENVARLYGLVSFSIYDRGI